MYGADEFIWLVIALASASSIQQSRFTSRRASSWLIVCPGQPLFFTQLGAHWIVGVAVGVFVHVADGVGVVVLVGVTVGEAVKVDVGM